MATATAEKQKKDSTEVLDLKNMIGGEFVDPTEGKTEDVFNPATGEVIAHSPALHREGRRPGREGGAQGFRDLAVHDARASASSCC